MAQPRRHHYVPESLLAGFTPSQSREDSLWCIDLHTKRQFKSRPKGVAKERDLYRVDVPGHDSQTVEKLLGQFEGEAIRVIRRVILDEALPRGKDYETLMWFIAIQATRVPGWRNTINTTIDQLNKLALRMALDSKERWESQFELMRKDGLADEPPYVSYEDLRDYVEQEQFDIHLTQESMVRQQFDNADIIVPHLSNRSWSLYISPADDCFICTDSPVSLIWTTPMPPLWRPGFGQRATEVSMPLSSRVLLVGRFEKQSAVRLADYRTVALYNRLRVHFAGRWVFAPHLLFSWFRSDRKVGFSTDLYNDVKLRNRPAFEL